MNYIKVSSTVLMVLKTFPKYVCESNKDILHLNCIFAVYVYYKMFIVNMTHFKNSHNCLKNKISHNKASNDLEFQKVNVENIAVYHNILKRLKVV